MRLSEERISFLAHSVWQVLKKEGYVDYPVPDKAKIVIKKSFNQFFDRLESIDQRVRQKIGTLKRTVFEGSQEWDILFRQYFDEEIKKTKF